MSKKLVFMTLVLAAIEATGADTVTQAAKQFPTKEFSRVTLAGGQRIVDAVQLMEAESGDPGRVVLVEKGVVSLATDAEVEEFEISDSAPEIRRAASDVTVKVRFGTGSFSRNVQASGRVGSFVATSRQTELRLKYVAIAANEKQDVQFAVSWRFYDGGRLLDSGAEIIRLGNAKPVPLTLKGARAKKVPAEADIQMASLP